MDASTKAVRNKGLLLSVSFAFASKVASGAVQLFAIPYGLRTLGVGSFAAYASSLSLATLLTLWIVCFGPRLVAEATNRHTDESWLFRRATKFTAINSACVFLLCLVLIWIVDIGQFLPPIRSNLTDLRCKLFLTLITIGNLCNYFLLIPEAFQSGQQKNFVQSLVTLTCSLISFFLIKYTLQSYPFPEWLCVCVFIPTLVGRTLNALFFVIQTKLIRSTSIEHTKQLDYENSWNSILASGITFTLTASVAAYATNHLPLLLISYNCSENLVAILSVLQSILSVAIIPVSLVIGPVIPAVLFSIQKKDSNWASQCINLVLVGILVYCAIFAIGFLANKDFIVRLWLSNLSIGVGLAALFVLYLGSICVEAYFFVLAHAFGRHKTYSLLYTFRIIFTAIGSVIAAYFSSLHAFFAVALFSTIAFSVVAGAVEIQRILRDLGLGFFNRIESKTYLNDQTIY